MELAISALEYPPMRTRVAEVARPLYQRVVRLDHLEAVGAVAAHGHGIAEAAAGAVQSWTHKLFKTEFQLSIFSTIPSASPSMSAAGRVTEPH